MMQRTENMVTATTSMRRRAERDRMARFEVNGIRAVPLDGKLARWQASITGPANSSYEGGTFYLYIYLPLKCVHQSKPMIQQIFTFSIFQFQLSIRTADY